MCTEIVARNFYIKKGSQLKKMISQHETKNQIYLDLFGFFSKPNLTLQDHNPSSQICQKKLNTVRLGCNDLGLCYTSSLKLYLPGTN